MDRIRMTNVLKFERVRLTRDERNYRPGECTHHHLKLDSRGGIVTCVDCNISLSTFWALTMLSEQYQLALANIDRLTERLATTDARIISLSAALDKQKCSGKGDSNNAESPLD